MTTKSEKLKEVEALLEQSPDTSREESPPPPVLPESSPAPSYCSSLDETMPVLADEVPSGRGPTEYGIYYTKSHTHMIICSAATERKTPLYFVEVSEFTYKKTDVQMHQIPADLAATIPIGSDLTTKQGVAGPVIAVARFPTLSRDFNIGFGDPDASESAMVWEKVKNVQAIKHGQYDLFHINNHEGSAAQPVKYSWHRTHAQDDDWTDSKWKRNLNMNCWKLVDHRKNQTVALVTANLFKKWNKAGKMLVYGGVEQDLEVMIMLTFCAISEKARRREWKRRSAAAAAAVEVVDIVIVLTFHLLIQVRLSRHIRQNCFAARPLLFLLLSSTSLTIHSASQDESQLSHYQPQSRWEHSSLEVRYCCTLKMHHYFSTSFAG